MLEARGRLVEWIDIGQEWFVGDHKICSVADQGSSLIDQTAFTETDEGDEREQRYEAREGQHIEKGQRPWSAMVFESTERDESLCDCSR